MSHLLANEVDSILRRIGVNSSTYKHGVREIKSPLTGEVIAATDDAQETQLAIADSYNAFLEWRAVPAPRRGELVRLIGEELRAAKEDLGKLITLEIGKSLSEGLGEVQEMIDICDYAVGLSRQLYGLCIPSERPNHRLTEQWHPIGPIGIISAFNFPVAVWSWNAALALICGDSVIWKPSEKAPLTALAVHDLCKRAQERFGADAPASLLTLLLGGKEVGEILVESALIPVISATGSTSMGRNVGRRVAERFGRSILELGGNNAAIVTQSADLDLALRASSFGAMGTAGQRCTTLRRLFVHSEIYDRFVPKLISVYQEISVGNPLDSDALVGPLIDEPAFLAMQNALQQARESGACVHGGARVNVNGAHSFYVRPALVEMHEQSGPMLVETFAPILYVMRYERLEEAIELQNRVPQGLSSSIFATDMREVEQFLSAAGSDCGIANVNMGTSGAEIGGAFGGEKETGGGRESGSDAWKAYMRRQTNAINYGREMPLAQGVTFDISS